jgi:homoserine kinase
MPDRLVVTAPASSANLGPGFDCMAIALDLRNRVELRRQGDAQVVVESEGEGAGEAPGGPDNLFVRAFEAAGADSRGLTVRMTNRIPFARGLGSSAATIAAGLVAGRAWAGAGEEDLLSLATALEGHPDNVAAALNGGVTLAWSTDGVPAAVGLGDPGFELVAVVPSQQLSTAAARAALPASVPHADAVHTAARAALLVAALGYFFSGWLRTAAKLP